jgi:hypothetical protein
MAGSRVEILIAALMSTGQVEAPAAAVEIGPDDCAEAVAAFDARAGAELAGDAPALNVPAAAWGLRMFVDSCRFLVYRDIEAGTIARTLSRPCPAAASADVWYSADLFLRYLPDLVRLARAAGESDVLVDHLLRLARDWPLSSVGIGGVEVNAGDVEKMMRHPALGQLYIDRIIERRDATRLAPPAVRAALQATLGNYPELAPEL